MFVEFEKFFVKDGDRSILKELKPKYDVTGFLELFQKFSGSSFNQGLYHLVDYDKIEEYTQTVLSGFPNYQNRAVVFSFDWLGRAFALDGARRRAGEPLILSFDLSRNEVLEIPCSFAEFHNSELVEYSNDAISSDMFKRYLDAGFTGPDADECCGPKVPVFLGGTEDFDSLEVIDIDVYWHLTSQLIPIQSSGS